MSTYILPLSGPKELQTRFIYPFLFHRQKVREACEALGKLTFSTRKGEALTVWESVQPHALYEEELLEPAKKFLFKNSDTVRCGYLRISNRVANLWFNKIEVSRPNKIGYPVRLVGPVSIELFLTWYGVGLLSASFRPIMKEIDVDSVKEFNYRLSQLRPQTAALFYIRHPENNGALWAQLTPEIKGHISSPPSLNAPLDMRLGKSGGTFLLREVIEDLLLHPLKEVGLKGLQNQLSVYTVARFSEVADFGNEEIRASLVPFLAGLSQIEEPTHAGQSADALTTNVLIVNSRHLTSIGLLGASHLVADQPQPKLSFNEARVPRVFLKYFIPYLVAFLQRTILQHFLNEASELAWSSAPDKIKGLSVLWEQLLEFSKDGYFTAISLREPIQQYFDKCQQIFNIPRDYSNATKLFADMVSKQSEEESRLRSEIVNTRAERQLQLIEMMSENVRATKLLTEQQVELAKALSDNAAATNRLQVHMTSHLGTVASIQMKVEWIEIFVVGFYTAELMHMIISLFEKHYEFELWWSTLLVLSAGLLAGLATWLMLKPGHQPDSDQSKRMQSGGEQLTSGTSLKTTQDSADLPSR